MGRKDRRFLMIRARLFLRQGRWGLLLMASWAAFGAFGFHYWEGEPIRITVSIGVTFLSTGIKEWDAGELLQEADNMLYEAKRSGRNRIFVHFHKN
jgi:GGDEF domain-containing protein